MAHVHFFLNPKGGTGKSLVSYIVAQYLISKGVKTTCIDCDPVTPTLIAYEALHAVRVNIMVENNIDKTRFDRFVELRECPAYTLLYQFSPKDTGQSKVK